MIGPKTPPKPKADVLSEALNLIAAFGSKNTELAGLLQEMKAVQEQNEAVFLEATDEVEKTKTLLKELDDQRLTFARHYEDEQKTIAAEWSELKQAQVDFEGKENGLKRKEQEQKTKYRGLEQVLKDRAEALKAQESRFADLALRESKLVADQERLQEAQDRVNRRENALREALNS